MNFNLCTTPVQSSIKILQTELGLFEGQKWDHCLGRPSPLIIFTVPLLLLSWVRGGGSYVLFHWEGDFKDRGIEEWG